ncbi:MAG: hypothetical protein GOU98_03070 [Candidatus Altiarchaeota archaeon]|nr:hypothetical protein [Candidatus Altiarchaeota archaeon]
MRKGWNGFGHYKKEKQLLDQELYPTPNTGFNDEHNVDINGDGKTDLAIRYDEIEKDIFLKTPSNSEMSLYAKINDDFVEVPKREKGVKNRLKDMFYGPNIRTNNELDIYSIVGDENIANNSINESEIVKNGSISLKYELTVTNEEKYNEVFESALVA